jgi:acyl-coenzyme A thioesterase PaaI-like protein
MRAESLQERYAPRSACFGCGPANAKGLRIGSVVDGDDVIVDWRASPEHEAFPGVLAGGIIGTLLDCHMNWTAAYTLMRRDGLGRPRVTVTASYEVTLLRPTPTAAPVRITARVVDARGDRATVEARLEAGGEVCATGRGTFVAVKPGHPAYGSWD